MKTSQLWMSKAPERLVSPLLCACFFQNSHSTILSSQVAFSRFRTSTQRSNYTNQSSPHQQADARPKAPQNPPQILHHLSPSPDDYSRSLFVDKCTLTIQAGSGGNGCVSFLRDVHISDGPPNGGDGGTGGNVWIQAVKGHTSLYKLARRRIVKAARGIGGQGGGKGGSKGEDVLIQVPVGTVVREISRYDPSVEEYNKRMEKLKLESGGDTVDFETLQTEGGSDRGSAAVRREKWIYYPGAKTAADARASMPSPPEPRRSAHAMMAPNAPIGLDLSDAMEKPMLLVAGGVGGLGNPHFATSEIPKPKYASKGELGVSITLQLELKLLADVGLVGLPNAGKSTLLRSVTNSRTRVGDWAFTTLSPSIGTVVLDDHKGRPRLVSRRNHDSGPDHGANTDSGLRTDFTIADIPGLIEDAHLDKGLGLGFLRHVERARILAFVVDLSAGDAVEALKNLWKEVSEYENAGNRQLNEETEARIVEWRGFGGFTTGEQRGQQQERHEKEHRDQHSTGIIIHPAPAPRLSQNRTTALDPLTSTPISSKAWFVVATKADKSTVVDHHNTNINDNDNDNDNNIKDNSTEAAIPPAFESPSPNPKTTHQNFNELQSYIQAVQNGTISHPSGRRNAWRRSVAVVPVSAIRGEGVERIKEWVVDLLDGD